MSYFNTTSEVNPELAQSILKAKTQNGAMKVIFEQFNELSPSQAHAIYCRATGLIQTPITSIRRSFSTLSDVWYSQTPILEMTDKAIEGIYGKKEHIWKLIRK